MGDSASFGHLCKSLWRRMGVPINTLILYQILLFESIRGIPFASITSLTSLKTSETTPNEESSSAAYVSNSINNQNSVSASPIPESSLSSNCELNIGLPIGNTNNSLNQNQSLPESNHGILTSDTIYLNVPVSFTIKTNSVSLTPVSAPSSSTIDINLDVTPSLASNSTSRSVVPVSNKNLKSYNIKRGSRDTISQEPCFSGTQQNLERLSSNFVSNFPSPVLLPCSIEEPVDVSPSTFNFDNSSEKSGELSKYSSLSSPFQRPILTNFNSNPSFQNNLLYPQENPNMLLARNLLNKRKAQQNSVQIDSAAQSNNGTESSTVMTLTPTATPPSNASPFAEFKNDIDFKQILQSDRTQTQPIIQNKISDSHMDRLKNNLMNAKIPQSNKTASQISECNSNGEYANQNSDLNSHYENVVRIKNSVTPKFTSNNGIFNSIPRSQQTHNNDDNRGCPQIEAMSDQDNRPFTQNYYDFVVNSNECQSENNNNVGNTRSLSLNNLEKVTKNNLEDNECSDRSTQNNNYQGFPLLTSIPVYSEESLLNTQIRENNNIDLEQTLQNNCVNINNNNVINLNQNVQGCPQLFSIAQNSLYSMKNNEACTNNRDISCIETPMPNDNLAQALKMVKSAKIANVPSSTINILPFGEALLDGKPMNNNLIKVDSVSCPAQLPTCTSSDSSNSKKCLTIQDVSKPVPIPPLSSPLISFSCSNPLEASVPVRENVMLSSPFNSIQTESSIISNMGSSSINLASSVPTISSVSNTESSNANQPFIISQEPYCNNNILPMLTLMSTPSSKSPIVTPNFIPVQSLPQVTFVNNLPTSVSVTPSLLLPNNCITSIPNLPSVCNSFQQVPSYSLVATNLQQTNNLASTSLFPSINNMVTALTQNIISTLMTKPPSTGPPLASLPPVNPFTPACIAEVSSINSPLCLDISEPSNYIVSTPLSATGLSLSNIPVACNEYLPPIYSPPIPTTTFNTDLFCVESDSAFDCCPFALSTTDEYYPEISFMMPSCSSLDCSCISGPLFMPTSSLPQSPSVIKINNTGREAKSIEEMLLTIKEFDK